MNVTRALTSEPSRSACSSSCARLAGGGSRAIRSAGSRASASSAVWICASICVRIVVAKRAPATASAITAESSAAAKNLVWKVARPYITSPGPGCGLGELVAELLDGHQRVDQEGQLLAQ